VRTFDEAWADAQGDAADCQLCGGTGYLHHGMVVSTVQWVATLVSCSHPPQASADRPPETDDRRTTVVGAHRQPEGRRGSAHADGSPPASGGTS
jgi:hypothetical protein